MSAEPGKEQAIHNVMDNMSIVQQKSLTFVNLITKRESLTQNQLLLLFQLRLTGSLNISDIAERFVVTPGAASSMCDKLEDLGLIERVRLKDDRRVVRIILTGQGQTRIHALFDSFETAQLEAFSAVLAKINLLMNEIME